MLVIIKLIIAFLYYLQAFVGKKIVLMVEDQGIRADWEKLWFYFVTSLW